MMTSFPHTLIHIVFDSYISRSLKGAERERRGSGVLDLAKIDEKTMIPTQMDKFLGSSSNKIQLQQFFADTVYQMAKENDINLVVSGTVLGEDPQPSRGIINKQEHHDIGLLKSSIEEADGRIIPHIHWSLTSKEYKNFVVLSNDTDVLVLILHYYRLFKQYGIKNIWIRIGRGAAQRLIPLHHLYSTMPKPLVKVLLAAHIGTGCDALSKIGTN
jgi:hypothetical protein